MKTDPKKGRKRPPDQEEEKDLSEYYRLNTKAVEDLVTADVSNSPKVSREELNKYRSGPKITLKTWVKVILMKWWFAGAACFFFYWGLGVAVPSQENLLLILGAGLGFVIDLLENNILRYYASPPGANDRWMMVTAKGFKSLPLNLLYGYLLLAAVVLSYNGINGAWIALTGPTDTIPVGVEPILFGALVMGWDMAFLGMKRVFGRMLADAKKQAGAQGR
jgi:hypothetical protein